MSVTINGTTGITTPDITTDDLTVDTNTLYVDATNNRVGIGTSSPTNLLTLNATTPSIDLLSSGVGKASILTGSGGNLVFYTGGTFGGTGSERMRIDSSGNLYLNTTTIRNSSMQSIDFDGNSAGGMGMNDTASGNGSAYIGFLSGGTFRGSITNNNNTAVAYNITSDYRLKDNVIPMSDSIDRLKQLKPSTWTWIQNDSHGEGFLAHEVQTVVPEAVTGTKDAVDDEGNPVYQGIDQSKLVPLLTAALQEAITKIEALEARVATLEGN